MITLITGTPGAGKTLYSLRFLLDVFYQYSTFEKFQIAIGKLNKPFELIATRYIYAHGITGLTLEHEIIVCESLTCDFCRSLPALTDNMAYKKVKDWNSYAVDGSVFFIDECQHIYRSKGSMSVSEFETHRHKGLDFFMVTQHPMLINTDLRRLVGRHIHLIADFLGRHQYEWVECNQSLSKTNSIKSKYSLDKSLFCLYQSASIHTKQQKKFPFVVYVLIFSIIALVVIGFFLKKRFTPKVAPVSEVVGSPVAGAPVSNSSPVAVVPVSASELDCKSIQTMFTGFTIAGHAMDSTQKNVINYFFSNRGVTYSSNKLLDSGFSIKYVNQCVAVLSRAGCDVLLNCTIPYSSAVSK